MRENGGLIVAVFVVFLALIGIVFLAGSGRDRGLELSVIGTEGLLVAFDNDNIAVRKSSRRLSPQLDDLSVRILPLYDVEFDFIPPEPRSNEEALRQNSQREFTSEAFETQLFELQTIVMLPKWTAGAATSSIAHDVTLISPRLYENLFEQIGLFDLEIQRSDARFESHQADNGNTLALFHAQLFDPDTIPATCDSVVEFGDGVLIIACDGYRSYELGGNAAMTYFVSDPDLMNNHGLGVADNAQFVTSFVSQLLDGDERPVYLDTNVTVLTSTEETVSEERVEYERGSEELTRFFDYPFSVLWALLVAVAGIFYWRGSKRFGPTQIEDDGRLEQSRAAMISSKSKVLRMSRNDGHMVSDFVQNQISDMATQILGEDYGANAKQEYFKYLAKRDEALAKQFQQVAQDLIDHAPEMPAPALATGVQTYLDLLERVVEHHGPIRISDAR